MLGQQLHLPQNERWWPAVPKKPEGTKTCVQEGENKMRNYQGRGSRNRNTGLVKMNNVEGEARSMGRLLRKKEHRQRESGPHGYERL